jgi:hypothetical protein
VSKRNKDATPKSDKVGNTSSELEISSELTKHSYSAALYRKNTVATYEESDPDADIYLAVEEYFKNKG